MSKEWYTESNLYYYSSYRIVYLGSIELSHLQHTEESSRNTEDPVQHVANLKFHFMPIHLLISLFFLICNPYVSNMIFEIQINGKQYHQHHPHLDTYGGTICLPFYQMQRQQGLVGGLEDVLQRKPTSQSY